MDQKTSVKIFVLVAGFVSIYHIILGLIGTFAPGPAVASIANTVFGVTVDPTPQFFYFAKFISALFITFGLMMALVAKKPYQYGHFAWVAVAYFVIRIFDRLVFFDLLNSALGTTMSRNMVTVIPLTIIVLCLIFLRPKSSSTPKR